MPGTEPDSSARAATAAATAAEPAARRGFVPLRALLLASVLVPLLFFAIAVRLDHGRLMAEARATVDRTTVIAREHALKVIETNSLVLDRIEDRVRGLSWDEIGARAEAIHHDLRALDAAIEQITALHLVAPDGGIAAVSVAFPAPAVSLATRPDFRRHVEEGEAAGLVFGPPVIGRVTGQPGFTMTRRRAAPDGSDRFDGVVIGTLQPAYFQRHWTTLAAGADVHFGLLRLEDGMLLARMPPPPALETRMPPEGALMRAIAAAERGSVVVNPTLDGGERLVGFQRIEGYPLAVFFALSLDAVRAAWWRNTALAGAICLLAALALGAATLLAGRRWRAEQEALARLAGTAAALRAEIARREAAEAGLFQAQRLEAVGRLTGGVAHDFNNLLTAILGSVQLLERHLGAAADARTRRLLGAARDAVERGARLNRSLLAFARRQALRAEPLDANALIHGLAPLIQRALGEAVELRLDLVPILPPCRADAAQLEAALINLAINARDAMPKAGGGDRAVTIRTRRLSPPGAPPGRGRLSIAVADTGQGMPPEVRERAFEPFFTTKPPGKGTGLGLSQVYGVVRQLGGDVAIDSAPGAGTTVRLELPEADPAGEAAAAQAPRPAAPGMAAAAPDEPAAAVAPSGMPAAAPTVLVVEDDPAVLEVTAESLRDAGYRVVSAPDGRSALAVLERCASVDLLFTDVVMPGGLSGVDLARAARRLRPGLAVLLASGYAGGGATEGAAEIAAEFELLGKPYDRATLLARLAALPLPSRRAMPTPAEAAAG